MNNAINPYSNLQETISLKLKNFVETTVDFKFMFFMEDMSCKNEPMYTWFVNTRKLASGLKKDADRHMIKNQRRETSWINDDFGYWSSATRYFVIGYAIEECKTRGVNLAIEVDKIANIFNDEIAHKELITRFLNDFFYESGIDIHGKNLCRNRTVPEYSMLKACFVNGYRLCADLYLAMDQAKKMGPVHSYMQLIKACQSLGFDELPLWYIQENSNHSLNNQLNNDVEAQKHVAAWAFSSNDGQPLLIAKNDPYGVEGSAISQPSNNSYAATITRQNRKPRKARSTTKKDKQLKTEVPLKPEAMENPIISSSLDALLDEKPSFDEPLDSTQEEVMMEIEVEVEREDEEQEEKPKPTGKPLSLLTAFST
ncbi:MAG: hypothetical protein J6N72_03370 [Psychrobacter sp.]|nr:hypothetical protein [Psychrobacter sp.]